jgi:RecJ-like exonuclease
MINENSDRERADLAAPTSTATASGSAQSDLTTVDCIECGGSGEMFGGFGCDECDGQGKLIVSRKDMAELTSAQASQAAASEVRDAALEEAAKVADTHCYGPCGEYDYSYNDASAKADERAEQIASAIRYLRTNPATPASKGEGHE